jgi:YVTN family beta-propeller protein
LHLAIIAAPRPTTPRTPRQTFKTTARFALAAAALASVLIPVAGCGNTYRPVVTAINPVGPASQPQKYAVAVSSSPNGTPGLMTLVDFSGDTILVTPQVGVGPYYLQLDSAGFTGYTFNRDGTLTSFDISTTLQTQNVVQTTLLPGAAPVSLYVQGGFIYIAQPGRSSVGELRGFPPSLQQELPVSATPVYVVGSTNATRAYALSQGASGSNGNIAAIETTTNTISTTLPVGKAPVYGVMTADGKRAFILNNGDNTVSVVNSQTNQLDGTFTGTTTAGSPTITAVPNIAGLTAGLSVSGNGIPAGTTILSATGSTVTLSANATASGIGTVFATPSTTIPVGVAPIWADLAPTLTELVVANAGSGSSVGSVTLINIPLCSTAALPSNPNCDPINPIDAVGFGQVLANVPVGHGPVMVSVLQDAVRPRAYVANYADSTVSVVDLISHTVTATIPVVGRPIYIAATTGTPTGKVYVVSADIVAPNENSVMTVIRTDIDTVSTTVNLQGIGVSVRVTAP